MQRRLAVLLAVGVVIWLAPEAGAAQSAGAWEQFTEAGKIAYQQSHYGEALAYFQAAVKEVDKQGLTKVTEQGTRAGIKMQKAIWMLAAYGGEDDIDEQGRNPTQQRMDEEREPADVETEATPHQGEEGQAPV